MPVYASGVWSKGHLQGALDAFRHVSGPVKLRLSRAENAPAAQVEYASEDFHRRVMLPFYDRWLKGMATNWDARPAVEYEVRESRESRTADAWPPEGVGYLDWFLSPAKADAIGSLNDGGLAPAPPEQAAEVGYAYPDDGWMLGNVGFGDGGPKAGFDPAKRVLTFTTRPIDGGLLIVGPIALVLYLSSTNPDTDVFVRFVDQPPNRDGHPAAGKLVSAGWLRASHRSLEPDASPNEPRHRHDSREPLTPGEPVRLDIALAATAWRLAPGHRLRLEIANTDSPLTVPINSHVYPPRAIGEDRIHMSGIRTSRLRVPMLQEAR